MTCVVAVKANGKVWFGYDSCIHNGYSLETLTNPPKAFVTGEQGVIIGSSGTIRVLQVLYYKLALPIQLEGQSDDDYIADTVVDCIRETLKANGAVEIENSKETLENNLLIGFNGELYYVGGDFGTSQVAVEYRAIGSGRDYAIGALDMLSSTKLEPKDRIMRALRSAAKNDPYVRKPFFVINSNGDVLK
jgi:ATP-dependent protease HslVU (ClpYQ) peptidase subunit